MNPAPMPDNGYFGWVPNIEKAELRVHWDQLMCLLRGVILHIGSRSTWRFRGDIRAVTTTPN